MTYLSIVGRNRVGQTLDNHIDRLRAVLGCMRTNKFYANASKCIFDADEITVLG